MGVYTDSVPRARVGGTMHVSGTNPRFSVPGSAPAIYMHTPYLHVHLPIHVKKLMFILRDVD